MLKFIRSLIASKSTAPEVSMPTYSDCLQSAIAFTASEGLKLDNQPSGVSTDPMVLGTIASKVSQGLYEQIAAFRSQGLSVPMAFGGQCGNVHYIIAKFILSEYPGVEAHFALGNVAIDGARGFDFSQEKFKKWREAGHGKVYDCHSWIAFGDGTILDATIATWINTRRHRVKKLGGILYRMPGTLRCAGIENEPHQAVPAGTRIEYQPVALGLQAFSQVQNLVA